MERQFPSSIGYFPPSKGSSSRSMRSARLLRVARREARRALSSSSGLAEENAALRMTVAALQRERETLLSAAKSSGVQTPIVSLNEKSKFVGAQGEFSPELKFWYPDIDSTPPVLPCFRLIDDVGLPVQGSDAAMPPLEQEVALACMRTMLRVNEFEKIFHDAQRQGRIPFFLTSRGEEACAVGSIAALRPTDWVLPQYREMGAFFWRGFTFQEVANQLCANEKDPAHGRQLPLHMGSKERHILYVKSTLGTQCPHAAGVAYSMKTAGSDQVAITYFGEGCASEGDVSSALNIAAVHGCPTIFFCRNNGYAISTNTRDQYVSDGVAPRGLAFGMPTIRVDGNDLLAVMAATKRAREIATTEGRPCLIEAMTYRIGAHSTSDDDSKYRTAEAPEAGWDNERAYWEARSPIIRFGRWMQVLGWWDVAAEEAVRKQARKEAIASLNAAQETARPKAFTLFTDVYDELPWTLAAQHDSLKAHLKSYPKAYDNLAASADL